MKLLFTNKYFDSRKKVINRNFITFKFSSLTIGLKRRFAFIVCMTSIMSGCGLFSTSTPAPVYQGPGSRVYQEPITAPQPEPQPVISTNQNTGIEIKPLATAPTIETVPIPAEPLSPDDTQHSPELADQAPVSELPQQVMNGLPIDSSQTIPTSPGLPIDSNQTGQIATNGTILPPATATPPVIGNLTETPVSPPAPATDNTAITNTTIASEIKPDSSALVVPDAQQATPQPPSFQPLENFAPLSPVVGALVLAANKSSSQGNIDSATTTIERAIRIEPRNATLFYKLALLRLKQSKPGMAEDLAQKSLLLASGDNQLKKHCWLLIAKAREMQNKPQGAEEARGKADKF